MPQKALERSYIAILGESPFLIYISITQTKSEDIL